MVFSGMDANVDTAAAAADDIPSLLLFDRTPPSSKHSKSWVTARERNLASRTVAPPFPSATPSLGDEPPYCPSFLVLQHCSYPFKKLLNATADLMTIMHDLPLAEAKNEEDAVVRPGVSIVRCMNE